MDEGRMIERGKVYAHGRGHRKAAGDAGEQQQIQRVRKMRAGLLGGLLLAGCAAQEPAGERYREQALQAAYEIGQIQMSCPEATPTVTSSEIVQPRADSGTLQPARREYTIDVAGCGADRTYLIVCREDGGGCAPAAP